MGPSEALRPGLQPVRPAGLVATPASLAFLEGSEDTCCPKA